MKTLKPLPELTRYDKLRFFSHVDTSGPCWLWTGPRNSHGYGILRIESRQCRVHRIAYTIYHGAVPDDLLIMHKCNIKLCVTKKCLIAGTNAENMQMAYDDGLMKNIQGEGHYSAKLNNKLVKYIWLLYDDGARVVDIAAAIGVSDDAIRDVLNGKRWKHVERPVLHVQV